MRPGTETLLQNPSLVAAELQRRRHPFQALYPAEGRYSRTAYKKHIEFFAAGAKWTERAALGGNRVGKSNLGSFEAVCHLTGLYPDWWTGRKFKTAISAWAAGDTSKTVRDIMQAKLMGPPGEPMKGLISPELIVGKTNKLGVPGAYESIRVKHVSGGTSVLAFKSYDQKRQSFQGTSTHLVWLDEEVDEAIYTECVMRTMATPDFEGGMVYLTFTPLMGLSKVVQQFLPDGVTPSNDRYVTLIGWDDVPHLDPAEKAERIKKIPEFQRDARTKGLPSLGSGAIYPMAEEDILVDPFPIPKFWKKSYALDVGGGFAESSTGGTAAVWGAINPETGVCYLYDEYFRGGAEPSVHAQAIKARGAWMKGVVDPAARGRSQVDGRQLLQMYRDLGLDIGPADNSVETGLWTVWDALSTGMLKVFSSLTHWRKERNLYRRNEKGHIVKEQDHLQDACLAEDTLVDTDGGQIQIKQLVDKEGYVVSRDGALVRFQDVRKTRSNAHVVALDFADGSNVVCTPDHRFLTPEGWVAAESMAGKDCFNGVTQKVICRSWLQKPRSLYRRLANSIAELATTFAESISNAMALGCIGSYGNTSTGRTSRMGTIFTTGTTIEATTRQGTWNACLKVNIIDTTGIETPVRQLRLLQRPQNGTSLPLDWLGTRSTTPSSAQVCTSLETSPVSNAEPSLPVQELGLGSARTIASPGIAGHLASTTKNAFAWSVARSMWLIATKLRSVAAEDALVNCVSVTPLPEPRDVYCMSVPFTNAFCVEGGLVVHNCRYWMMSGRDRATVMPSAQKSTYYPSENSGGSMGWIK